MSLNFDKNVLIGSIAYDFDDRRLPKVLMTICIYKLI